jgi:hypothetical protein
LLGLSTLWLSCGTLARDIEECQIQVVATKPIARWQIWLGKWLGIVTLNAACCWRFPARAFSACCNGAPPEAAGGGAAKILREQVLVARGSAKEAGLTTRKLTPRPKQILQERLKSSPVDQTTADLPEVRKQIREQVKADFQLVPPGYTRANGRSTSGFAKNFCKDKPLQLRVKFNARKKRVRHLHSRLWQVGDAGVHGQFLAAANR